MKLKLDLHVHTTRSHDAFTPLDKLPILAKTRGLDGVAVTDHNSILQSRVEGIIVVPGVEVSTSEGHVIGLGVTESIPRGLTADETIDKIHGIGGVAVIPHPYDLFRSSVTPERLSARPDAIEVVNSASFFHSLTWWRARHFAEKAGLPAVAGSDSHIPRTVGRAYTVVEAESEDIHSIIDGVRKGFVMRFGSPISVLDRVGKLTMTRDLI